MSLTVSRGFHTAAQWGSIAGEVLENLELRSRQVDRVRLRAGTAEAFRKFFLAAIEGVQIAEGLPRDNQEMSYMDAICDLTTLTSVLRVTEYRNVELNLVRQRSEKYMELIDKLERGETIGSKEYRMFGKFLRALAQHASHSRRVA